MDGARTIGVILGGGEGSRMQPLTLERAKPAVPIAGKFRLVDLPLSNCINSGIREIYLLTQYSSASLHRHVQATYNFDQFSRGFVRLLAAEQTMRSNGWFQGTADAVRQSIHHFMRAEPDLVVILSGDHLYRMDLRDIIHTHLETGADVTVSTKPVERSEAGSLGIMQVDRSQRIVEFFEKPGDGDSLTQLRAPMYEEERYLASMGIYVFNVDALCDLLSDSRGDDFGKQIIPKAIRNRRVYSYVFEDYWKDIGTIRAYWEASLALTEDFPSFTLYDMNAPIYTRMRFLPPTKINHAAVARCLLAEGSIIDADSIEHSVVGLRAVVREGTRISDSILLGADYYGHERGTPPDAPAVGIGRNCRIERAIIDKNVRIGDNVVISPEGKDEVREDLCWVRDGIIVIPRDTIIPEGTVL
ncbi:glucose-1-phosphate adenylyltransferase [Kiritimatiella glycovorans]|uniref:Glucose-1-phosphate adenylyltransferase n=1 Tax=Kiritimatiella glycovorans TaxID=1307763 RepID=A0A0G3EH56_9BACT|nr:glucose-1-phosphate adenylyltransferase [Kiritimatiella glycovorans]AKJ64752.1 Glucose-1-phosphate adenylyltransferase [Kiritimatiella glycovorans]